VKEMSLIRNTILECQCELQPCYSPGACVNTIGGFSCKPCPPGLWGAPLAGTGLDYAKTHKQVSHMKTTKVLLNNISIFSDCECSYLHKQLVMFKQSARRSLAPL
ncbi:hypothetical protein XENOCAPTIV_028117, partial [Xenoophorus captivus]